MINVLNLARIAGIFIKVSTEAQKLRISRRLILSKAAILVFGAVPALFPAYIAFLGTGWILYVAVAAPPAAVVALWPLAGLYGVAALWMAVFGQANRTVALGLIAGILAMLPLSTEILRQPSNGFLFNFFFLSPVATATVILFQLVKAGVFSHRSDKNFGDGAQGLTWVHAPSEAKPEDYSPRRLSEPSLPALVLVIAVVVTACVLVKSMSPEN